MSLTAAAIVVDGCSTLLDTSLVAWPLAERIGYLNEAIRATVFVKPDAYPVRGVVTPVAGTVQTIPADGVALIDITHNSGTGRVITQVDADLLKEADRFWPRGTQQDEAEHFAVDVRDARRYMLFPPNDGSGSLYMVYGAVPAPLTTSTDALPLPDSYQPALLAYVLSRAYAKNSKRQDLVKAQAYRSEWGALLGLKSQAQVAVAPHVAASTGM